MTSQTIGILWVRTAAEASAYSWLENLAQFNSGGYCPQTNGNVNQKSVTAYLNSVSPWSGMRRCNILSNGIITAWQNASLTGCGYTDTPTTPTKQVGWTLPAFYYWTYHLKTTDDANTYRWFISPTGSSNDTISAASFPADVNTGTLSGFTGWPYSPPWKLHPAFSRGGVRKPYIVLGAYEGHITGTNPNFYLNSTSGVTPTGSSGPSGWTGTIAQFRSAGQKVGTGWGIHDYLSVCAYQLPYLIEYGGFNSQLLLGGGNTNSAGALNTGATALNGNTSYGVSGAYTSAVSYRGLENPYGNIDLFVDGINMNNGLDPWIADHGFVSDTFVAPYTDTTLGGNITGYFISDIGVNATYDYGFIPSASTASATTKLCDMVTIGYSNPYIMFNSGFYGSDSANTGTAGMFTAFLSKLSSYTAAPLGARLMYIPQ